MAIFLLVQACEVHLRLLQKNLPMIEVSYSLMLFSPSSTASKSKCRQSEASKSNTARCKDGCIDHKDDVARGISSKISL